jgi:hypothetical protein
LKQKVKTEQKTEHEWVCSGYVVGFMTNKGLVLDLDNMKFKKAKWLAERLCKQHHLEGYLLIKSSEKNYHVVFNRYLRWRTITKILFNQYEALRWAVFQMQSGYLTLRISRKNGKNKPKIMLKVGKTDKLIKDYLEIYEVFKDW